MKKLFKLLFALSLLVLVACGSSQESEEPEKTFETSGTAVYIDRIIEKNRVSKNYESKSVKEYVEAMNEAYGEKYFQVVEVDGESKSRFTQKGRLYFQGVDPFKVNSWFYISKRKSYIDSDAQELYNNALKFGGDGSAERIRTYQQMAVMGDYVDWAEIDKWALEGNKSLADYNAHFLGSGFMDRYGHANDAYWSERDRFADMIEEEFYSYLTDDEYNIYNFTSDVRFDNDLIVYNTSGHFTFAISREFSVYNPNGEDDIEGSLYITAKVEGTTPEILDKFVLFY